MIFSNEIEFENVVQADPTLKFFLREAELEYDNLEHQVAIIESAIVVAIYKYLDLKYK